VKAKSNKALMIKVFMVGVLLAFLSYWFHPSVGQLTLSINGAPVADPLVRFAAIPSLLIILMLTGLLLTLLFFGVGLMMFIGLLVMSLIIGAVLVPYFWPVLVIVLVMIALLSVSHREDH